MPVNVGYGASYGNNYGGGGIISVFAISPTPNSLLDDGYPIDFTIGVSGSMIDLESIHITVGGEPAFDGSSTSFGAKFTAGSSYEYSSTYNGYSFSLFRFGGYPTDSVTVVIFAKSNDGAESTQIYSLQTIPAPQYPPFVFGETLHSIPISSFSGESNAGLLNGALGQVFFTTGLIQADTNVQIDVDDIRVKTESAEKYQVNVEDNLRPLLWGPPQLSPPIDQIYPPIISSDYSPVFNGEFSFVKTTKFTVRGVYHDNVSGEDTEIYYLVEFSFHRRTIKWRPFPSFSKRPSTGFPLSPFQARKMKNSHLSRVRSSGPFGMKMGPFLIQLISRML